MVAEAVEGGESEWGGDAPIAELLGVGSAETVRKWVRQQQIDVGGRPGVTTEEAAEIRRCLSTARASRSPGAP